MLVEVMDDHGNVHQRQRFTGVGARCRLGRSLACDMPVDDAFAAPEHATLTLQPDGRVLVQDLGTRNGTRLGGRRIDVAHGVTTAGGELWIGRTRVRVRTGQEQLVPERLFRRDLLQRHRTLVAVTGVALCMLFAAFMAWMRASGQVAQGIVFAMLVALAALAIWAGTWALVSRLSAGAWQLRIHLAIAAACLALWGWGYWLYTLAAFAFQWRWLGPFAVVLAGLVSFAASWRHLHYATRLRRAVVLPLAVLVPLLSGGLWWLIDLQVDPRTVNRVVQGPRVLPPGVRVAPSVELNDYLADVTELKREASRNRQLSLLDSPILDEGE